MSDFGNEWFQGIRSLCVWTIPILMIFFCLACIFLSILNELILKSSGGLPDLSLFGVILFKIIYTGFMGICLAPIATLYAMTSQDISFIDSYDKFNN